jgi:enhancing lycopene biosynthesis protein 2
MKKFAVVLSGCGVFDGAEIHEATLSLYTIASNGGSYEVFAPDMKQHHVINHITGEEMSETRNVLIESARIARGKIMRNSTDCSSRVVSEPPRTCPTGHLKVRRVL